MALRPIICPSCNGQIDTFDEKSSKGFCPFCGNLIVDIPELQRQFKTDAQGRVVVSGIEGSDELFERIRANQRFNDKVKVRALAKEFTEKYPLEFRGWQVLCDSNLEAVLDDTKHSSDVALSVQRMSVLAASSSEREYLRQLKARLEKRRRDCVSAAQRKQSEADQAAQERDRVHAELETARKKRGAVARNDTENGDAGFLWGLAITVVSWIALASWTPLGGGYVFVGGIVIGVVLGSWISSSSKAAAKEHKNTTNSLADDERKASGSQSVASNKALENRRQVEYLDGLLSNLSGF